MNNLFVKLLVMFCAVFLSIQVWAAEATYLATIKTQIASWYGSDGFITVIGTALALAAAAALAFKWIKGMIFS